MDRIVINEYIDLEWKGKRPVIIVAGKEFVHCSFLAVSLPAADAAKVGSIDELAADERARSLEGKDAMGMLGMAAQDVMQAHASNLIAWAENGYDTRILHSNLSFPLLKELAKAGDAKALRVLRGEINERLSSGSMNVAMAILECCLEHVDEEGFHLLSKNEDAGVRRAVALNPSTPAGVLERLAGDANAGVRRGVTSNQSTPAVALERLAGDVDAFVRLTVAWNPSTPVVVLERLAGDVDVDVRRGVALNPITPAVALGRLAGDVERYVRYNVARNPSTPARVLERLAGDVDAFVRLTVAWNPSTPARMAEMARGGKRP